MEIIPYGYHSVDNKDRVYLAKSLLGKHLTGGNLNIKFENKLKKTLGSKYLTVCSSGTSALHLAFLALGLKKDDIIIMPAINFIASYNMASVIGARVYLADVDSATGQMTPENVEQCIKDHKLKKIKIILTMYLGGRPENIFEFYKLKKKYKCFLVEDSCHALGAYYNHNKKKHLIGSNIHSDISTFSFHPVKGVTTGEGGCITATSKNIYKKILQFKNHGISRNAKKHWDYDIDVNGFNYRISDINCALGISQLSKLKKFNLYRNKVAKLYRDKLNIVSDYLTTPNYKKNIYSSYHLFVISIKFEDLKKNKDFFFKYMLQKKVMCQFHYKPIYNFKVYKSKKINKKQFNGTENYYKNCLSIPIYYKIGDKKIDHVTKQICNFINKYKI
jgi:dTDP-4-amino-4,6-dideoxygalactose transaminase